MKKTAILLLPLILLACNSQRQFDRIVKKHPEYLNKYADTVSFTFRDTIQDLDTFVVKGDTVRVPSYVLKTDTFFTKGRVTLKSRNGWVSAHTKTDTFFQRDTIKIEIKSKAKVFRVKEPVNKYLIWTTVALGVLLILALLQRLRVSYA